MSLIRFEKVRRSKHCFCYKNPPDELCDLLGFDSPELLQGVCDHKINTSFWNEYESTIQSDKRCLKSPYVGEAVRHTAKGWKLIKEYKVCRTYGATCDNDQHIHVDLHVFDSLISETMNEHLIINESLFVPALKLSLQWEELKYLKTHLMHYSEIEKRYYLGKSKTGWNNLRREICRLFRLSSKNKSQLTAILYEHNINNIIYSLEQHKLL